ncbi:DUF4142 domain-containing protein [Streptomyces sp. NPDC047017]|uniref:DUF4142 domain-containing protein n=1 Tax=Streptomyces sp. NPDC047017 TaxID=3155024 RepID=UPI003411CED0
MRPRPPVKGRGVLSGTGVIVAALAGTVAALVVPLWLYAHRPAAPASAPGTRAVAAPYGALSGADRDFLTGTRLADLWELPAAQQAQEKGTTDAVRAAGRQLVQGHTSLDRRVRDVAARLGLRLPDEPTAEQQRWLDGLGSARPGDYDRTFTGLARNAEGKALPSAAEVRASTRNALVRALAAEADTTALDDLESLEATGLVDDAVPSPPPPTREP